MTKYIHLWHPWATFKNTCWDRRRFGFAPDERATTAKTGPSSSSLLSGFPFSPASCPPWLTHTACACLSGLDASSGGRPRPPSAQLSHGQQLPIQSHDLWNGVGLVVTVWSSVALHCTDEPPAACTGWFQTHWAKPVPGLPMKTGIKCHPLYWFVELYCWSSLSSSRISISPIDDDAKRNAYLIF